LLMGTLYIQKPFVLSNCWNYALHRISRVLPLFYLVVLLALVLRQVGDTYGWPLDFYQLTNVPRTLRLQRATGIFWTIPVEVQFYAAFMVIWFVYSRSNRLGMLLIVLLGVVLFPIHSQSLKYTLISVAPFFLAGVLLSFYAVRIRTRLSVFPWSIAMLLAFPAALSMFPRVYGFVFHGDAGPVSVNEAEAMWHNPACFLAALCVVIASISSKPVVWLMSTRVMTYLGKISYSTYLLHLPVILGLAMVPGLVDHKVLFFILVFAVTFALATFTQAAFEMPVRLWINRRWDARRVFGQEGPEATTPVQSR
jgi:peptidoglycan/LPS O-acetylase OafA/YrhL